LKPVGCFIAGIFNPIDLLAISATSNVAFYWESLTPRKPGF
jgi:hypothetical protein